MNRPDRLRGFGAVVACVAGSLAGAVAGVRGHNLWWGLAIGVGTSGVLLAIHAITQHIADQPNRIHRPVKPVTSQTSPPPEIAAPPPDQPQVTQRSLLPEAQAKQAKRVAVVFVHGLLSSPTVWAPFIDLITQDDDLAGLDLFAFEYSTPFIKTSPLQRIPDFDVIADKLKTYLEDVLAEYPALVLVTHSQGGLVAQRFLSRMLNQSRGLDLTRVKRLIMFACPNTGSQIFLVLRRMTWFWRHPQERELRPLNEAITAAHRVVLNQVVHAAGYDKQECPISVSVYAGEVDNIVTPASALSVFPGAQTGVLPGDHFTIVRPDSPNHSAYITLRRKLLTVLNQSPDETTPATSPGN